MSDGPPFLNPGSELAMRHAVQSVPGVRSASVFGSLAASSGPFKVFVLTNGGCALEVAAAVESARLAGVQASILHNPRSTDAS